MQSLMYYIKGKQKIKSGSIDYVLYYLLLIGNIKYFAIGDKKRPGIYFGKCLYFLKVWITPTSTGHYSIIIY